MYNFLIELTMAGLVDSRYFSPPWPYMSGRSYSGTVEEFQPIRAGKACGVGGGNSVYGGQNLQSGFLDQKAERVLEWEDIAITLEACLQ